MSVDAIQERLTPYIESIRQQIVTEHGQWTVKGFIDIRQRIYPLSLDTKVLSKVFEWLMQPVIVRFALENDFEIFPNTAQNHYPDITLVNRRDRSECYALDIKSTYKTGLDPTGQERVNGMTLGSFTGYFRTRDQSANSTQPYGSYRKHYVLGVIYRWTEKPMETTTYTLDELDTIPSVIEDFSLFLHEKYRIASDMPGSGNTKNIGSTRYLERLLNGTGVFASLGQAVFDDYWMNYRTREMAIAEGFSQPPYTNLPTYHAYKSRGSEILSTPPQTLRTEDHLTEE